ncbi:hypothetical protein CR513_25340, partial [Mucuna pruriens]
MWPHEKNYRLASDYYGKGNLIKSLLPSFYKTKPSPPQLGESSQPGPISNNPLKSSPIRNDPIASSTLAIQQRGHLSSRSTTMSFLEKLAMQSPSDSVASVCIQPSRVEKSLLRSSRPSLCRRHLGQSNTDPLYEVDPELELTLRRLRKARKIVVNNSSSSDSIINFNQLSINISASSSNILVEPGQIKNDDRTLKELATPDVLELAQTYELKYGLIHLLPKFHGLAREDPYKHLKEFHVVYSTMRPQGILEHYIKMKAFPFSLDRAAKDWLYLQPALINTWGDMKRTFLEKFFPASRTASIWKEICGIRQHIGQTLHEY